MIGRLILCCLVVATCQARDYMGHSVLRLKPSPKAEVADIFNLIDSDSLNFELLSDHLVAGKPADIRVSAESRDNLTSLLRRAGVTHSVVSHDLQREIDFENEGDSVSDLRSTYSRLNLHRYNRLSDITSHLHSVCSTSRQQCRVFSIGRSYERRQLSVIQIGSNTRGKKVIWIDGGIHAREWITPAVALILIDDFLKSSRYMSAVLQRYVIYVMPNLNPDGYEYTWTHDRMWRKTRKPNRGSRCVGTDANRNWGYKWGGTGSSSNPCSNVYHGTKAFSESETQAVQDFLGQFRNRLALFLSMHSNSQCWLIPFGYTYSVLPRNYKQHVEVATNAAQAQYSATRMRYSVVKAGQLANLASGESYDWGKAVANADFSFIIELRLRRRYGFLLPRRFIEPTGREMIAALHSIFDTMRKLEK